jgi:hypothetical protein
VHAIEQQHGVDRREIARVEQDGPNGAVAGAENPPVSVVQPGSVQSHGRHFTRDARQQRIDANESRNARSYAPDPAPRLRTAVTGCP